MVSVVLTPRVFEIGNGPAHLMAVFVMADLSADLEGASGRSAQIRSCGKVRDETLAKAEPSTPTLNPPHRADSEESRGNITPALTPSPTSTLLAEDSRERV